MSVLSSRSSQSSITSTSHMTSTTSNAEDVRFEQWQESFFFPLYTEISRRGHLPKIIYIIQMVILFLQEVGVTMWCGSSLLHTTKFYKVLYYFTDWNILRTDNFDNCVIQYSIGMGVFFFTNLFLIYVLFYYYHKRIFLDSQIIILRLLFYPILDILLPFYACLVARSFVEISSGVSNGLSISFFVISIIIFIISVIELRYCKQFSTNTPVIDRSLLGSWDDDFLFLTIFSICYGSLLSTILDMFPKWLHVAAIIGYIILVWYRIYMLYFVPMLRFFVNSIFLGICIMCNFNLLLSLIHLFVNSIPSYIYFVITLVTFIGGVIFSTFWFDKKKKKLLDVLSYKSIQQNDLNDQNVDKIAHEHFDQIVFSSARDAISYIHVGVAFHADLLIDITFLRYLMINYAETSIIFAISKAASFFASDPQFLSYCLSIITRIPDPTTAQNYLIYQIRRIHVIRQSSVSVDASNQLLILQKMSRDTISQVRGFWSEIMNAKTDISFASLRYLRKITLKTDSAFIDARDRFPNSVSILNEYCRFQIEGMGDFSGAINSGKKVLQLNQGENLIIDHAFRSLVNVYPNYLLKNVMNARGDLLKKDIMMSDSFETMSSITSYSSFSTNSSSSSQIEFEEKYEEIISQLYNHGKLRVSLQSRMKSTHLKSLTIAQTWSLAQLLCCILVYLVLIIYVPTLRYKPNDLITCANGISQMTLNMYQISSIAAIQHVINLRDFSGISIMKQLLGIKNKDLNTNPSLMTKPFILMANVVDSLKDQYEKLLQLLMGTLKIYSSNFPEFYEENNFYRMEENKTINISLRSSIAFFISDAEIVSSYGDNPSDSKTTKMIELMINVKNINDKMNQLQKSIGSVGESIIKNSKKTFFLISILVIAVCFTVFGFFRILNIVSIFKQAKKCSDILRKTSPDLIKQSFMPIAKMGSNETICGNNVHNAHEINIWLIMYPIVVVLSILTALLFVLSSIVIFTVELAETKNIFDLLYDGTVRFTGLMNSLITFCLHSSEIISESDKNESLTKSIEMLRDSQESIDMKLMGSYDEIDSFYFTQSCSRSSLLDDFADYVRCLSIDNKINIAYSSIMILSKQDTSKKLNDHNFASLVFIIDMFLAKDLVDFQDLLVRYSNKQISSAAMKLIALSVTGLLVSFLVFLIEHMFSRTFLQSVDAIKQLIAMLPPVSVVTSSILMDFLNSNSKSEKYESLTSAPDSIISETTTASILVDHHFLIQAVNSAVNATTGFTPDQILGQKVDWLIPFPRFEENGYDTDISINSKFYATIQNMLTTRKSGRPNNNTINNNNRLANGYITTNCSVYNSFYTTPNYSSIGNSLGNSSKPPISETSSNFNLNINMSSSFAGSKLVSTNFGTSINSSSSTTTTSNLTLTHINSTLIGSKMISNNSNSNDASSKKLNKNANNSTSSISNSRKSASNVEVNEEEEAQDDDADDGYKGDPYVVLMTKCLTESGSLIPAKTTVLRVKEDSKSRPQVVLFIRDLSDENEKERELEDAKMRTEKLLKSIIPSQLEDLSSEFTADVATIILVEVSGLTEYVHTMSPQTLMQNLGVIYDSFEKKAKDFPAVSIVKTDSELLVACCGLFDHIGEIEYQVAQSVLFCSKMLDEMETINEQLDIDLHLRIAVNVGGPALGRLLNARTPSFEIVGPLIELAQRIVIEGENDVVQVGETVLQFLEKGKFEISNGMSLLNQNGTTDQIYIISNVFL